MVRSKVLAAGLIALASQGMPLCLAASTSEAAPEKAKLPNVVVVMIDTLRADHTSLESYPLDTTPGIARIAARGMTFRRHFSNAPWTRPSIASILTGLLPPSHGAQWGDHSRSEGEVDLLPDAFDTLPELLRAHGYETHAFVTNPTVSASLGYAQGFDRFELGENTLEGDRRAVASAKRALDSAGGPAFVWCHLMAPHNYRAPGPPTRRPGARMTPITETDEFGSIMIRRYQMRTREQAIAVYDAAVAFADAQAADLFDHIRTRHPDTLVVVTSDHGEEFAEHGGYLHSRTLYNELLRVPLVLWGPEIPEGETVNRLTSSVDVLPTVLDYLGIPAPFSQGRSLLDPSPGDDRFVYAEKRNGTDARRAWISEQGKLIETKPPGDSSQKPPMEGDGAFEFFADPDGADDVDAIDGIPKDLFARAVAQLEAVWAASRKIYAETTGTDAVRGKLTEEDREKLRALGYID
jgi:membrane-anchored protein YejM (alkaline phosphatase superfamily)